MHTCGILRAGTVDLLGQESSVYPMCFSIVQIVHIFFLNIWMGHASKFKTKSVYNELKIRVHL